MHRKMHSYRELGHIIDRLLDRPQTGETMLAMDILHSTRARLRRGGFPEQDKRLVSKSIPRQAPKILEHPPIPEEHKHHLHHLPLAAVAFAGES
ncbi:MAG: hypothetical protein LBD99_03445 [Candidatus Margulisbacteria bacterium]|nr:hypothetical protein [Candidatus Margulisiibacteriota bacterium]